MVDTVLKSGEISTLTTFPVVGASEKSGVIYVSFIISMLAVGGLLSIILFCTLCWLLIGAVMFLF